MKLRLLKKTSRCKWEDDKYRGMKMKCLFLMLWLGVSIFDTYAQSEFKPEFSYGIKGGMNSTKVKFMPPITQNSYYGMLVGIVGRYKTESWVGVQMELNYSVKGWEEDLEGKDEYYRRVFQTLELPLLTTFNIKASNRLAVNVNMGPQLSYTLKDEEYKRLVETELKPHYGMDLKNNLLFMLTGGLGLEVSTGMGNFIIEGRYCFSFSDFFGNRKADVFQNSQFDYFSVSITYLFK